MAAFLDKNALSIFWGKLKSYLQDNFLGKNSKAVSATTADKVGIETKGSATQPVYINAGTPTACTYSLAKSVPSDAVFTDTTYSDATASAAGLMSAADKAKLDGVAAGATAYTHPNTVTAGTVGTSSATSGSTLDIPYVTYNANGHITATGTHIHTVSGFAASSHTHNYAGSSSAGGAATTANKLGTATVGSSTQPVYLNAGTATACGFKIAVVTALPSSPDANTLYFVK